jgi:hypothetical protein
MFKKTQLSMNYLGLVKKVVSGAVRFDLEIQRRAVWTEKQKQDLIDSLIFDFPVPPLYFVDLKDDFKWALDGQQRSRAMTEFFQGKFVLSDELDNYVDDDGAEYMVAGLSYAELPQTVQTKLNSTNVNTYTFSDISEDEITIMFQRLNAGTAFKKIELIRIDMPTAFTAFINEVSRDSFFADKVAISDKARVHFSDQELILQTLIMFSNADSGFTGKEIQDFVSYYTLEDDVKDRFREVLTYLNKAFVLSEKLLKKTAVPVIFKVAEIAIIEKVQPEEFYTWTVDFFKAQKTGGEYGRTVSAGSARKENVKRRLEVLRNAFTKEVPELKKIQVIREKAEAKARAEAIKNPPVVAPVVSDIITDLADDKDVILPVVAGQTQQAQV